VKIVVTGGAGFIGANLVRALRGSEPDWGISVIDDLSTGTRANLDGVDGVVMHEASIMDDTALDAVMGHADAVVHLAARPSVQRSLVDPLTVHEVNATGTLRVLDAARRTGVGHVILASSSSVYGAAGAPPLHEALPTTPLSPYGASKLAAESYALAFSHCHGLPVLVFRLFDVFGPWQRAGRAHAAAIPAFVAAAAEGRPLSILGDGRQTRDFTYVGGICEPIVDALRRRVASDRPFNLAFGTRRTLLDVIDELSTIFGQPLQRMHIAARPGDMRDAYADPTRMLGLFPDAHPTDFGVGLKATVDWRLSADPPRAPHRMPARARRDPARRHGS
jgi:UDP-glucose 4-epimerase